VGLGGGRKEKIKTFVKPHCFIEFHLKASSSRFFYNVVQEILEETARFNVFPCKQ